MDCRESLTNEVTGLLYKKKSVVVHGATSYGKSFLLDKVHENITNSGRDLLLINTRGATSIVKLRKEIFSYLKYPREVVVGEVKVKKQITDDEVLEMIEEHECLVYLLLDDADKLNKTAAGFISNVIGCENVVFLLTATSMKSSVVQEMVKGKIHQRRQLFTIPKKNMNFLFDFMIGSVEARLEKIYNKVKRRVVHASNKTPGLMKKIINDLRKGLDADARDIFKTIEHHNMQVAVRHVYLKQYMIILPIIGFSIAFCQGQFSEAVVRNVTGTVFAGVCLSLYRLFTGWGTR